MSYKKNKRKAENKRRNGWVSCKDIDGCTKNGFIIKATIQGCRVINPNGYMYKRKFMKNETAKKFAESKMKD